MGQDSRYFHAQQETFPQKHTGQLLSTAVAVYMGVLWRFFLGKIRFYCARLHVGGIITFRTASNTKGNNDTMIPGKILISHSLFL